MYEDRTVVGCTVKCTKILLHQNQFKIFLYWHWCFFLCVVPNAGLFNSPSTKDTKTLTSWYIYVLGRLRSHSSPEPVTAWNDIPFSTWTCRRSHRVVPLVTSTLMALKVFCDSPDSGRQSNVIGVDRATPQTVDAMEEQLAAEAWLLVLQHCSHQKLFPCQCNTEQQRTQRVLSIQLIKIINPPANYRLTLIPTNE